MIYEITKWATPPLTLLLIYFVKDFKSRVEKDIHELKSSIGKAAIDIAEHTGEIGIALAKMESTCEIAKEKVSLLSQQIESTIHKLEYRVDAQKELITKTAQVLSKHSEEIKENQTVLRKLVIDKNNYRRNGNDE